MHKKIGEKYRKLVGNLRKHQIVRYGHDETGVGCPEIVGRMHFGQQTLSSYGAYYFQYDVWSIMSL